MDQLFKSLFKFRYLRIGDLPQEIWIEGFSVNVLFPEHKRVQIIGGAYLPL